MTLETPDCKHENCIRMLLEFDDDIRKLPDTILPFSHQVNFCMDCWQVCGQERGRERRNQLLHMWARFGRT